MPFTAVPSFVDDTTGTAADLNILGGDIAYLYGLSSVPNLGFERTGGTEVVLSQVPPIGYWWYIRHRLQYLKLRISYATEPAGSYNIVIRFNGNLLLDSTIGPATTTTTFTYDLNDTGLVNPTPTLGSWYSVYLEVEEVSDGVYAYVDMIYETEVS